MKEEAKGQSGMQIEVAGRREWHTRKGGNRREGKNYTEAKSYRGGKEIHERI